jgi:hypothetical protein
MSICFWRVIGRARKSGVRERAKYILPTSLASDSLITEREETTMNKTRKVASPFVRNLLNEIRKAKANGKSELKIQSVELDLYRRLTK